MNDLSTEDKLQLALAALADIRSLAFDKEISLIEVKWWQVFKNRRNLENFAKIVGDIALDAMVETGCAERAD
jgi:hypothetical protein